MNTRGERCSAVGSTTVTSRILRNFDAILVISGFRFFSPRERVVNCLCNCVNLSLCILIGLGQSVYFHFLMSEGPGAAISNGSVVGAQVGGAAETAAAAAPGYDNTNHSSPPALVEWRNRSNGELVSRWVSGNQVAKKYLRGLSRPGHSNGQNRANR
jgi:hypothetical protein